jgi:hypothetical protein
MSSIFWSWQSDLEARVTRDLVREALAQAIDELHVELDERHELTSDTKGVAGSPDIMATILAKIDAAAVFVGDVTPIAVSAAGKALANPNVLIELGYAKKSIGLNRILLVWNTAFEGAKPEALPFDLRGRRAPIGFELAPGATRSERANARDKLKKTFVEALRASLATLPSASPGPPPEWQATSQQSPAVWSDPAQPLAINEGGVPGQKTMSAGRYVYARILPARWSAPTGFGITEHAPLMGNTQGFSWGRIKGGFLTYSGSVRSGAQQPMYNMTAQFKATGEMWAVDLLTTTHNTTPEAAFYSDSVVAGLDSYLKAALLYLREQGAEGPFQIRVGVDDLKGLTWRTQTGWGGNPQALEDRAEALVTLAGDSEAERLDAVERVWGEIADAFGVQAPDRPTLLKQIRAR